MIPSQCQSEVTSWHVQKLLGAIFNPSLTNDDEKNVSMIWQYRNHTLQTIPQHHEEEP